MKLWFLSQDINNRYDTFDNCVVAAETEEEAKKVHPSGDQSGWENRKWYPCWAEKEPEAVSAVCIGEAAEGIEAGTVICSSFNGG